MPHVLANLKVHQDDTPGVRGHPGVKEHSDHKPRNALSSGLADELARTQNYIRQHIYMFVYIIYSSIVYLN